MRYTHNGQPLQTLRTTTASDGAKIEYQARGRDFWVTKDGEETQALLASREKNDPDGPWWQAIRAARRDE